MKAWEEEEDPTKETEKAQLVREKENEESVAGVSRRRGRTFVSNAEK